MSTQKIIKELLDENLIGAKREIEDLLYEKLGEHLNEMYVEIAPTLLGEAKKKKKKKGAKPDFLDLDGDGDKDEPMKKAAKEMKEDYDEEEEEEEENEDEEMEEEEEDENESENTGSNRVPMNASTPNAATLRPGGAPRDEPGDLSQRKQQIMSAISSNGSSSNTGTGAY